MGQSINAIHSNNFHDVLGSERFELPIKDVPLLSCIGKGSLRIELCYPL